MSKPKPSEPSKPKSKVRMSMELSVASGILEETMDFMKVSDADVAMQALGKHARRIMQKYSTGKRMKYWSVLDSYALFCLVECKQLLRKEFERALSDFEDWELWLNTESKLSAQEKMVVARFPNIWQYVLQQESRTSLRADLPKMTNTYVYEQYLLLKRLISGAFQLLNNKDLDEKDAHMALMLKDIVHDLRKKASGKVMGRISKHQRDCMNFLEESLQQLNEAKTNKNDVPSTPRASELKGGQEEQEQAVVEEKKEDKKEEESPTTAVKETTEAVTPTEEKKKHKKKKNKKKKKHHKKKDHQDELQQK